MVDSGLVGHAVYRYRLGAAQNTPDVGGGRVLPLFSYLLGEQQAEETDQGKGRANCFP